MFKFSNRWQAQARLVSHECLQLFLWFGAYHAHFVSILGIPNERAFDTLWELKHYLIAIICIIRLLKMSSQTIQMHICYQKYARFIPWMLGAWCDNYAPNHTN